MSEIEANKYLSLKAAAQLYGYTRDHLGLMIRQNKLNGIKLGSYYVTTNEWMTEYIKKYADPNHPKTKSKLSNRFLSEVFSSSKKTKSNNFFDKTAGSSQINPLQTNPIDSSMEKLNNNLQKEILDAFSSLQKITNNEAEKKSIVGNQNNKPRLLFELPYLILPIRKMEENEKERILKLLERNNDNNNETDLV